MNGRLLGPYRLEALLGAGGMGEVYRATDQRLARTVAIKILHPALAADLQFSARFEHEARAIAALNHPHICTLHDVGRDGDIRYLVMEYVDGETLADRLSRGALPYGQALTIAIEIAEALAAAHKLGIVHRDLKPANVMVMKAGAKLLDFGLARTVQSSAAPALSTVPTGQGMAAPITERGTILGTFQYMAPEQLEGRPADARTDIFAFGVLLYEMLTGERAFNGSSRASLIGAIMHAEPPAISTCQPVTPAALDRLVRTCLAKDPDDRWQSMRDVARELRAIATAPLAEPTAARGGTRYRFAIAATVIVGLLAGVGGVALSRIFATTTRTTPPPVVSFSITPPTVDDQQGGFGSTPGNSAAIIVPPLAVSPDGRWVAFSATNGRDGNALWVRALSGGDARPLQGTAGGRYPFWSPDSRTLAFFTQGDLLAVDVAGGPARRLLPAFSNGVGGSWGHDGSIVAARNNQGLWRIAPGATEPQPITMDVGNKEDWRFPLLLGGQNLLAWNRKDDAIYGARLDGSRVTKLLDCNSAPVVVPGWLIFVRGQTAFAQPFDSDTLSLSGHPRALPPRVGSALQGTRRYRCPRPVYW